MPFYKRQDEELLVAPNFVHAPNYSLTAEDKDEYTYPADGWYWFDSLDAAMSALVKPSSVVSVSPRQIRQAMSRVPYGDVTLREAVEAAVTSGNQDVKDWWLYSTAFEKDNLQVKNMAQALGVSAEQIDDLWKLASTL